MWLLFAFGSAAFAGITAILAKCGIKDMDSNAATAIRTIIVLIFSWLLVFIAGSETEISKIQGKTWIFLVISGLATGASWLCYFRALQLGDINKVTPVDKSSTVITMLLAFLFLHESLSGFKIPGIVLIAGGTYLMIEKKKQNLRNQGGTAVMAYRNGWSWLPYAFGSAVFAALTSIFGKVGMSDIDSNLGTAIRTVVVLVMAWLVVLASGKYRDLKYIGKRNWVFLILSGVATGASWLCYYRALKLGPASIVVPVDKLSIVITVIFSWAVFGEKLTRKSLLGLLTIVVGTMLLLV